MADGTIRIRWLAPLPVVEAAEAAEPVEQGEPQPAVPVEQQRLRGHHPPLALAQVAEPQPAVAVVEAAEPEAVRQPRPQHRRIFSAPSRICFMSPI
jgi:hypothetical protein